MTPVELRAYDFVRDRITLAGFAPSVREIRDHLDLSSTSGVMRVLDSLVAAEKLRKVSGKKRGLELVGEPDLRTASLDAIRAELARRGVTLEGLQARTPDPSGRHARCAADTCGAPVARGHLFCLTHWRAIPVETQRALLAAHRHGDRAGYQALLVEARDIADGCRGVA